MHVNILSEHGYEEAILGFSLSYNTSIERTQQILPKYAFGVPGESKFLESIVIWMDVTAPRFWWQEADTYRISTKQSESTMHTLCKKPLSQDNFEYPIVEDYLNDLNIFLQGFRDKIPEFSIQRLKNHLPEGFLQRRIWCMSYKTLQNIYNQRKNHRLPQWHFFLDEVMKQVQHPEFVNKDYVVPVCHCEHWYSEGHEPGCHWYEPLTSD